MNIQRLLLMICVLSSVVLSPLSVAQDEKGDINKTSKKDTVSKKEKAAAEEEPNLYLESTLVGDKEQPTVSYFIPWKGTGTPDNLHWNIEQKNDKTLDLIDREIMVRSMSIYNELDMEGVGITP